MLDLTKEQIVQRLSGGTVMRGWSAIAVLGRDQINRLLRDQWLQRLAQQSFIAPMNKQFDLDEGGESRGELRNVMFGPPQLAFENATLLSSNTTMRMSFLSAEYVQHAHLPGSPPILLRSMSVNEAMGYGVSAQVELKLQQSEGARYTRLMLELSDADTNTLESNLGTTPYASKQIGKAVFSHWLAQPGSRQTYTLAEFDSEDYASLSPRSVKALTQMAPWGARTDKAFKDKAPSEGDGAVVLMMQLRSHLLQGTLPQVGDDFPYLLPGTAAAGAEYSCTLLLDPINQDKPAEPLARVLRPVSMPNAHRYTHNASDKFVPADVVGFGQISPSEGTFRVEPDVASTVADGRVSFKLKGGASQGEVAVDSWSTSNLRRVAASGTITDAGSFTSGNAGGFVADSQVSLVTAELTDGTGDKQPRGALVVEQVSPVQISPRVMATGANGVPIQLSAASVGGGKITWKKVETPAALRASQGPGRPVNPGKHDLAGVYASDLGELKDLGNGRASFTPAKIEAGKPEILFQVIRATDESTQAFAEATVVIVTWPQVLSVEPFHVADYKPNTLLPFTVKGTPAGVTWHWFGEGKVDQSGVYTPPQAPKLPVTVVMADINDFNSGYAIIEHPPVVQMKSAINTWDDIHRFQVELLSSHICSDNGMQQIVVLVTIETKMNGTGEAPPISDEELGSLWLFNEENNKALEFLIDDLAGLEPVTDYTKGTWGVGKEPNIVGSRSFLRQEETAANNSTRTKRLYLHSTTRGKLTVAAAFTGDDNLPYWSTKYSDGANTVSVESERSTVFDDDAYTFGRVGVKGWEGVPDGDFDRADDTTDYWKLVSAKGEDFKVRKFLRLRFDEGSAVSMVRWESNQRKETYCSFTSFAFKPYEGPEQSPGNPEDPAKFLVYDGLLQALVKIVTNSESYLDTELVAAEKPERGEVCFAVHRVSNLPIYYDSEHTEEQKFRAALEEPLLFSVMDTDGNWHKLKVSFKPDAEGGAGRSNLMLGVR